MTELNTFASVLCTAVGLMIAFATMMIASSALSTWRHSLNAESNLKLRNDILDTISDWYVCAMDVAVATQRNRRLTEDQEINAILEGKELLNKMTSRLKKMHILVENTATHQELPSAEQKNKKELLKYIQDAMNIQGEIREYISQKTGIYGEAAEAFNAVTTPNHAIFEKEPYSKVQVCIKAISKASEYLLINKNL